MNHISFQNIKDSWLLLYDLTLPRMPEWFQKPVRIILFFHGESTSDRRYHISNSEPETVGKIVLFLTKHIVREYFLILVDVVQ